MELNRCKEGVSARGAWRHQDRMTTGTRHQSTPSERPGRGLFRHGSARRLLDSAAAATKEPTGRYGQKNRSSSFSHSSLAAADLGCRMVTTFSAEGGERETSLTTYYYDVSSGDDSISSVLSSLGRSLQHEEVEGLSRHQEQQQQQLAGFDLKAETDFLVTRTEQLASQKEWVI